MQHRGGILSQVGNTPLVKLDRLFPDLHFHLLVKLEALNPGGSSKDRPATTIMRDALRAGLIDQNSTIIESSSGNMGIGLAQTCACLGLRFICVVDPRTTTQNLRIMEAYGAEIEMITEPDPETGDFLKARLDRLKEMLEEIEGSFWPNQYANLSNPGSHYETTIREIVSTLGDNLDYLFCAVGTCGTIRGCAELIRDRGLATKILAVDAEGSVIFGSERKKRLIPGMGAGIRPPLCDPSLVDDVVFVNDLDCVVGCRRLVRREGILAGGSSGGVISAVEKVKDQIPEDAICVGILPDRGERYMDTVYSDEWVKQHFGDVSYLWLGGPTAAVPTDSYDLPNVA